MICIVFIFSLVDLYFLIINYSYYYRNSNEFQKEPLYFEKDENKPIL